MAFPWRHRICDWHIWDSFHGLFCFIRQDPRQRRLLSQDHVQVRQWRAPRKGWPVLAALNGNEDVRRHEVAMARMSLTRIIDLVPCAKAVVVGRPGRTHSDAACRHELLLRLGIPPLGDALSCFPPDLRGSAGILLGPGCSLLQSRVSGFRLSHLLLLSFLGFKRCLLRPLGLFKTSYETPN